MIAAGDIVEVRGHRWAVIELTRATPRGEVAAVLSRYPDGHSLPPTQFYIAAAGLEPIVSPSFIAGQRVRFGNNVGIVLRDEGDKVIVADERPKKYDGGQKFKRSFATPVARGTLARDNIESLTAHIQ